MARPEQEQPEWYGKHDNPHHDGLRAHQRKIASMEEELFEYTGVKGKHISLPKGKLSQREILELTESFELPT